MFSIRKSIKFLSIALALALLGLMTRVFVVSDNFAEFGALPEGDRLARIQSSPNFDGQIFVNPVETQHSWEMGEYVEILQQWTFGSEIREPEKPFAVDEIDPRVFEADSDNSVTIYWLGHATALIEIEGSLILTDPVWSESVFPFTIAGPGRFHPLPVALENLPKLDAVLISHDHFDHLDYPTIMELSKTGVTFFVPLGVGAHLESWNISPSQIVELDWWESVALGSDSLTLVCAPARHFSGRRLSKGSNVTLWSSWVIAGKKHRVFFSGDTGYFPGLKDIGDKYGPFDFTLIAIGAYAARWLDIHLTPEQAVRAHLELRGERFIPIHWGTFNLAFHDWFEPAQRLVVEALAQDIEIIIPRPGQRITSTSELSVNYWWREYMPEKIISGRVVSP